MKKQTLSVLSAIIVTLLLCPGAAMADQEGDYTFVNNGNGTCSITGYTGSGGAITIPGTLNGLTVVQIRPDAFRDCISLISVVIPDSVTTSGTG